MSITQKWLRHLKMSVATVVCAGLTSVSGQVLAQNNDVSFSLDEITVYATKGEKEVFKIPGMVSVIDRNSLDDLVANSTDDIFKGVPGVFIEGGPRRAGQTPSIRGFEGESVLILFDDARQSFVSGHDGRFFIDPDIMKKVEVVKGPSSALYGSGASGGVIAFQTINADDLLEEGETTGVRVKFGYQSVDNERSVGVTGYRKSKDGLFDVVGHVTYRDADDIELGSGAVLPSDDKVTNGLLKAKVRLAPETFITSSWIYTKLDGLDPQNPEGNNVGSTSNPIVDRDVTSSTFQTKFTHSPTDNPLLDLKIVGYVTNNEVEEPEIDSDRVTSRKVETLGFSAQNKSKFNLSKNTDVLFTYGFEYYKDDQTGSDSSSTDGTRGGVPNASAEFMGTFVQAEFSFDNLAIPGSLKLTPGVRFDKFSTSSDLGDSIDETAVSPKLSAVYEPTKWLMLFGNYGDSFRASSFNEAYASGTHFRLPVGPGTFVSNEFITNPDLKPEETTGWELGAGFKFDNVVTAKDKFKIKGSYWESDVTNLIDLDVNVPLGCFVSSPFVPPCGSGATFGNTSQNVNITNAELKGVEIEMSYDNPLFYAKASYSHIEGINVDNGEYVQSLTPDKFYIDAGIKLVSYDARIGARATFADTFDSVNEPSQIRESYSTYDIYAVWQPVEGKFKGLRLDLGVDNILDEDYEVVSAGVKEPGRNYKASISYKIPLCTSGTC